MDGLMQTICHRLCRKLGQLVILSLAPSVWAEPINSNTFISYDKYLNQYSNDVARIDTYSPPTSESMFSNKYQENIPDLDVKQKNNKFSQKNVSKLFYKILKNPKKLANDAVASAAYLGLDALGFSKPLKERIEYIKEKTRFNFGKCGKVEFSGKFKAESCLMDNSKIEFNSDYKLDSVTVKFKWAI